MNIQNAMHAVFPASRIYIQNKIVTYLCRQTYSFSIDKGQLQDFDCTIKKKTRKNKNSPVCEVDNVNE